MSVGMKLADQARSVFPGQLNRHHWRVDDPAYAGGTEEKQLAVFRRVQHEIVCVFRASAAQLLDARK
jgi:arsenate reductase (thioredoxin)